MNRDSCKPKSTASRAFKSFICTQFLGALNDNFLKTSTLLLIGHLISDSKLQTTLISLAGAAFVLPFLIFSGQAGYFADRYSKTSVMRYCKWAELVISIFALFSFVEQSIAGLMVALAFMGLHSTFFSPAKYGVLAEILPSEELSKGNGYLEFWTFSAILLGTALSGALIQISPDSYLISGLGSILIAALGLASSFLLPKLKSANLQAKFEINPWRSVFIALKEIKRDKALFLTLKGICYFWLIGAFVQLNILSFAEEMLKSSEFGTALLITALTFGVGVGSIYAGHVSRSKVELGLVPLGGLILALSSAALAYSFQSIWTSCISLTLTGFGAGLFSVPLHAFFQYQSPSDRRGSYIAANNFVTFIGILLASGALYLLRNILELNPAQVFLIIGIGTFFAALYIVTILPEILVRCVNWILCHSLYKISVYDEHKVPTSGGALLISNHVSFVDAALILAATFRPVRFIMYGPIYERRPVYWFAKIMRAIPIYPAKGRESVTASLDRAAKLIQDGELVCIFAEGAITRSGELLEFKRGFETIMQDRSEPIVPIYLDQLWGSIFSFEQGRFLWKWPKKIPYPVGIFFGNLMPANSKAEEVRAIIEELAKKAASTIR